ncbi:MAG: di-trans,poly-cis-decaprenylcistransferase [Synergistaceae bacterium]|nr:di-trans,poly-cis-decaprenylcistransferase [Synergistaceae bacterium]
MQETLTGRCEALGNKIPSHVAIIMDGNGRWAKKRGFPRLVGHHAGVRAVERTVRAANDLGIRTLSLYAFSSENWKRPESEVSGLMGLFRLYIRKKIGTLLAEGARIRFAGKIDGLPADIQEIVRDAEERTAGQKGLQLVICLNYGGRQELLDAMNRAAAAGEPFPLDEGTLRKYLYLPDIPDPDLIIRTSGEMRLSNFWLWQSAYSEFYFTDKLWPDFGPEDLAQALEAYSGRERRYGSVKPDIRQ